MMTDEDGLSNTPGSIVKQPVQQFKSSYKNEDNHGMVLNLKGERKVALYPQCCST